MQRLSKLIFSENREDRIIAGEIIYKNLHIFNKKETIKNSEYIIWTFKELPYYTDEGIITETGILSQKNNDYTIYLSRRTKSIYYYPNTKTHVQESIFSQTRTRKFNSK